MDEILRGGASMKAADHFRAMRGKSPEEAKFFWSGGPVEVAERTWFQSRFSGVTAFETGEGIVLVDSGMAPLAPALAALLREKPAAPIHTAIFTHGHVDHAFGLAAFLQPGQPKPRIIAQRTILDRFERYERTHRYNAAINARQFGGSAERTQAAGNTTISAAPSCCPTPCSTATSRFESAGSSSKSITAAPRPTTIAGFGVHNAPCCAPAI